MTMQVALASSPSASPGTAHVLQSHTPGGIPSLFAPVSAANPGKSAPPWAADLKPALIGRLRTALTESTPDAAVLSDKDVLGCAKLLTDSGDLTPEALLLFGTEHALARAYPLLKTQISRRDLDRNREKVEELPRNLIRQLDALLDFVRDEFPNAHSMQAEKGPSPKNHASLRDAALLPWFFEMAVSRDYDQVKPARLVRDRGYLYLEYPRLLKSTSMQAEATTLFPVSERLLTVLSSLYASLNSDANLQGDQARLLRLAREKAYFQTIPLRTEGRFFKITALLPRDFHGGTVVGHASFAPPMQEDLPETTPRAALPPTAMQASGTSIRTSITSAGTGVVAKAAQDAVSARSPRVKARRPEPPPHPGPPFQPPAFPAPPASSPAVTGSAPLESMHPPKTRETPEDRAARIVEFCRTPRHREEIQKHVGMNNRDHFRKDVLNRLIAQGLLTPTLPDKPNSPRQQYVAVSASGRPTRIDPFVAAC